MRPIDADALKEDLTRFYFGEVTAKNLIDEQPTVEPKRGRWIDEHCSECGWYVYSGDADRYCPHCGAVMLEDVENVPTGKSCTCESCMYGIAMEHGYIACNKPAAGGVVNAHKADWYCADWYCTDWFDLPEPPKGVNGDD